MRARMCRLCCWVGSPNDQPNSRHPSALSLAMVASHRPPRLGAETTTARRASPLFYSVLDEERYTHAEAVFFARASAVWTVVLTTDRCERSPSAVRQAFAIGSIFSADRRLQAQACRVRHDVVGVARWMQGFAARRRTGSKGSAWRG